MITLTNTIIIWKNRWHFWQRQRAEDPIVEWFVNVICSKNGITVNGHCIAWRERESQEIHVILVDTTVEPEKLVYFMNRVFTASLEGYEIFCIGSRNIYSGKGRIKIYVEVERWNF